MTSSPLSTRVHGKWILVGEHAALRGGPVLVFPLASKSLTLNYKPNEPFRLTWQGEFNTHSGPLFTQTLDRALGWLGRSLDDVQGAFELTNHIPTGSGLGASAALCVIVTRWLMHHNWLDAADAFDFARQLENLFHGQSSGVDILGVTASQGLWFEPDRTLWEPITLSWQPHLYLSFSGHVASTATCVKQVLDRHEHDPEQGVYWDQCMKNSVWLARQALSQDPSLGQAHLSKAIEQAYSCFHAWGLITPAMHDHIDYLLQQGALAAKPTGSGGGGYIVSLWETPPEDLSLLSPCLMALK